MTTVSPEAQTWSPVQKAAFRFCFIFFLFYIFFNPNGVIPFTDALADFYIQPFHKFIPWLAKYVLHMAKPITIFTNGSGDTTYDYLIMLLITVCSAIGTIIWSVTGRNTQHYNKLLYWLTVVVRYYAAITMITYGSVKVVKLQFPSPSLGRLLEPFGNASPMGLAWTYMGYSQGFNYFTGMAELVCGLLLFFRKTTTLGAVFLLVVAGNIMAINYCFDVPVKLLATMLVAMGIFLLVRDAPRLINFFFLNKDALPSNLSPHRFITRWKNITLIAIKYVLIAFVVLGDLIGAVQASSQYGDKAKKPPLYGIYDVKSFVRNQDTIAPLTTDTTRWSKLIINYAGNARIKLMNDSIKNYNFIPDTAKHNIKVYTDADTLHKYTLRYTLTKQGQLSINGKLKNDSLDIKFSRFDTKNFLLIRRGFHWVNEFPLNR